MLQKGVNEEELEKSRKKIIEIAYRGRSHFYLNKWPTYTQNLYYKLTNSFKIFNSLFIE